MGLGGQADLGLWIKTRDVTWAMNRTLTRISEVGVIIQFGEVTVPASPSYRQRGLKIGMQFRTAHQVGPAGQNAPIEFAAASKNADWTTLAWTSVPQSTGAGSVTAKLGEVFGAPPGVTWRGYLITNPMFAVYPPQPVGSEAEERLYFRVLIGNFSPHSHAGADQVNDVHVVPMVCILGDIPSFTGHYALGIGAFTVGHRAGAMQFDTETIAHDVPADAAAPVLPPKKGIKPPAIRFFPKRPKVLPDRPKPPRAPRPPGPGPDPGPRRKRVRATRRKRSRRG